MLLQPPGQARLKLPLVSQLVADGTMITEGRTGPHWAAACEAGAGSAGWRKAAAAGPGPQRWRGVHGEGQRVGGLLVINPPADEIGPCISGGYGQSGAWGGAGPAGGQVRLLVGEDQTAR